MNDELYDLYKRDADFKEYVDKWCKSHDLSIFEAFRINILQRYAEYIRDSKKDAIVNEV